MLITRLIAWFGIIALAGCAGQAATVATETTKTTAVVSTAEATASTALTVAEASLAAYEATKNPNAAVIAEATKLDTDARAAIAAYGPEATEAIAMANALAEYLLTSAPGNGVTPSTVPTAG
jgi:hypothetical protein